MANTGTKTQNELLVAMAKSWRITDAIDRLPLALGIFDADGQFQFVTGAFRSVLGNCIPSHDPQMVSRWEIYDEQGARFDPPQWPSAMALRREVVVPGRIGLFRENGTTKLLRVAAVPLLRKNKKPGGMVL